MWSTHRGQSNDRVSSPSLLVHISAGRLRRCREATCEEHAQHSERRGLLAPLTLLLHALVRIILNPREPTQHERQQHKWDGTGARWCAGLSVCPQSARSLGESGAFHGRVAGSCAVSLRFAVFSDQPFVLFGVGLRLRGRLPTQQPQQSSRGREAEAVSAHSHTTQHSSARTRRDTRTRATNHSLGGRRRRGKGQGQSRTGERDA